MLPLLTICPSRSRPEKCLRMVESFLETSSNSELEICLDYDDPLIDEYDKIPRNFRIHTLVQNRKNITQIYNQRWRISQHNYEYFSQTNDDFVYRTKDWDLKLMNYGINFGNDLFQGNNYPSTSVIHSDIIKAVGWLQLPDLTHLCGDLVWNIIGINCGCLNYCEDVIIEHITPYNQKCDPDDIFKNTNSVEMYRRDQTAYIKWLMTSAVDDVKKVKEMLCQKYQSSQVR